MGSGALKYPVRASDRCLWYRLYEIECSIDEIFPERGSISFLRVSGENGKTKTGKYSIINKYPCRIDTYRASIRLW